MLVLGLSGTRMPFSASFFFYFSADCYCTFTAEIFKKHIFNFTHFVNFFRWCMENAFGILISRWQIYKGPINLQPENVNSVVKTTCILQNFRSMTTSTAESLLPAWICRLPGHVQGRPQRHLVIKAGRCCCVWFAGAKARKCTNVTNSVRKAFIKYFKNEGHVYIGSGTCKGHKAIPFCTRSRYFKINNTCCYTLWKTQQSSSGLPTWCFGSESLHSRYPVRWPLFAFHSLEISEIG